MAPVMVVDALARYWWVIGLRGLAAIIFGILAFALPGITLAVLVLLFGAYALVDGVLTLLAAFRGDAPHRVAMLIEGVFSILAGLPAFPSPGLPPPALLYSIPLSAIL